MNKDQCATELRCSRTIRLHRPHPMAYIRNWLATIQAIGESSFTCLTARDVRGPDRAPTTSLALISAAAGETEWADCSADQTDARHPGRRFGLDAIAARRLGAVQRRIGTGQQR